MKGTHPKCSIKCHNKGWTGKIGIHVVELYLHDSGGILYCLDGLNIGGLVQKIYNYAAVRPEILVFWCYRPTVQQWVSSQFISVPSAGSPLTGRQR